MPDRQSSIRVSRKGAAQSAVYVSPDCQWQGTSHEPCDDVIVTITVEGKFPEPFTSRVQVCGTHAPPYRRALQKEGRPRGHTARFAADLFGGIDNG